MIKDQGDIIKNYEEEVAEWKEKNQELNAKIKELDSKLANSIEKNKKSSFSLLEEVKNVMTDANQMAEDPFKTIPSIKFVEGCEEASEKDDDVEQKSVKVISSCSSNVAEGYR